MSAEFENLDFLRRLNEGILEVKKILGSERNPEISSKVDHQWKDKFTLVEFLANLSNATLCNSLGKLGLSSTVLSDLSKVKENVTLIFTAQEECIFKKKEERVESSNSSLVKSWSLGKESYHVETKITEWIWKVDVSWKVQYYCGVLSNQSQLVTLLENEGSSIIKTQTEQAPHPVLSKRLPIELDITFFVKQFIPKNVKFTIDRARLDCHTPIRNADVDNLLKFYMDLGTWVQKVADYMVYEVFPLRDNSINTVDIESIQRESLHVFIPVLPLMESGKPDPTLVSDSNLLVDAGLKSLEKALDVLREIMPDDKGLVTFNEAILVFTTTYLVRCSQNFRESILFVEEMIRKQVIDALGKSVTASDFDCYMAYHNRKFFKPEYQHQPFSFSVRIDGHVPEGNVSIESSADDQPILTATYKSLDDSIMYFDLDSSTKIPFSGSKFLHGYLGTSFTGTPSSTLTLKARARQFSCFILSIGKLLGKSTFQTTHSIIIQNKDSLIIPILCEVIPSAKEFKQAISSLSPEQQRFAQAFRSMQLSSTLFALTIIPIKPQLEKVLNLPADSLTKEFSLTRDLMRLFIDYQIPSDLLSFDPTLVDEGFDVVGGISTLEKIKAVKKNVENILSVIDLEKKAEIENEKQEATKAVYGSLKRSDTMDMYGGGGEGFDGSALRSEDFMVKPAPAPAARLKKTKAPNRPESAAFVGAVAVASSSAPIVHAPTPTMATSSQAQTTQTVSTKRKAPSDEPKDESGERNFTLAPSELDSKFDRYDTAGAVRPVILSTGSSWNKTSFSGLLGRESKARCDLNAEKSKAFDLIDALTKSGALPLVHTDIHVLIAVSHNFEKSIMEVIVQDNVNPVEKLDASSLLVSSAIHNVPFANLVSDSHSEQISLYSPHLISE